MSMTKDEVMLALEAMGSEQTRKTFARHGAPDNFYGVKVSDLKTLVRKIKKDHKLSLALYKTGNGDAMYLAGLIADEQRITRADLQRWAKKAGWYMISEYTVAWTAAETDYGWELGEEWIEADNETLETSGWSTLANVVARKPDEELDIARLSELLDFVGKNIHDAKNRVRYCMNGFVIAVGSYVAELTDKARAIGEAIGNVHVDMGGTACKVPVAPLYIDKVVKAGRLGKKRRQARC